MSIYVYGDSVTKEIQTLTRSQLVADSRLEIILDASHIIRLSKDPYKEFRINDTNDDVETISIPKIYQYAKAEARDKHIHNINYKTELAQSLIPKRTMVQGEVTQVDWYSDQALTDKVLRVEINYTRDADGFALSRTTTRIWIQEDEVDYPEAKITTKRYDINLNEMLKEGNIRRSNLTDLLSLQVLGRMQAVLAGTYTSDVILQMGRDFLLQHDTAWNAFIKASHQQILTDLAAADAIHDEWLDAWMVDDVITIRDYMIAEMTLY